MVLDDMGNVSSAADWLGRGSFLAVIIAVLEIKDTKNGRYQYTNEY